MTIQEELQDKCEELGVEYARAEDYSKVVGSGHWLDALKALLTFIESLQNTGVFSKPNQEYQKQYQQKRENQQKLQEEHAQQISGNIKEYRQTEQKTNINKGKTLDNKDKEGPDFDKDQNKINIADVELGAKEQEKQLEKKQEDEKQQNVVGESKQQDQPKQGQPKQHTPLIKTKDGK